LEAIMTDAPTRSLPHHVERYLLRCEVEAKSPDTLRAYRSVLKRFVRILAEDGAPDAIDEVTSDHIYAYLGRFTHLSMDTRHRYFREVRRFFNWLVANGYLEQSPVRDMRNVKVPARIKQPFAPEEIAALLAACGDPGSDAAPRDRAMVLTLLDTGIRCTGLTEWPERLSQSPRHGVRSGCLWTRCRLPSRSDPPSRCYAAALSGS
jgi:integrase/recombinase XerC